MIDSDQRPDSNRHPLMSLSQINWKVCRFENILKSDLRIFSNRHTFQILRYMADLLVTVSIRQVMNLKKDIDLRIGSQFQNLLKG